MYIIYMVARLMHIVDGYQASMGRNCFMIELNPGSPNIVRQICKQKCQTNIGEKNWKKINFACQMPNTGMPDTTEICNGRRPKSCHL